MEPPTHRGAWSRWALFWLHRPLAAAAVGVVPVAVGAAAVGTMTLVWQRNFATAAPSELVWGTAKAGFMYAAASFAGAALGLVLVRIPVFLLLPFLANLAVGWASALVVGAPWELAAHRSFARWGWVAVLVGVAVGFAGGVRLLHLATAWRWWRKGLAAVAALVFAVIGVALAVETLAGRERGQLPPPPAMGVPLPPPSFPR